ncbi:MAG: caspase family protein [Clostridia bacterium]|nr:caspase family protein [Clostridia bacterium]
MNNCAFLVNCDNYKYNNCWHDLPDTQYDITRMETVLSDNCDCSSKNVIICSRGEKHEPRLTSFRPMITSELKSRDGFFDIVFFYFSGHGFLQDGIVHIVPMDSSQKNESIAINSIIKYIEDTNKAKHIVLILDCCQNEFFDKGNLEIDSQINGHIVFNSCAPFKSSFMIPAKYTEQFGHGSVFTYCIASALSKSAMCKTVKQVTNYTLSKMKEICSAIECEQLPYTSLNDMRCEDLVLTSNRTHNKWGVKEADIFSKLSGTPLVPSDSEICFYSKYLDIVCQNNATPRILILGSTYGLYKMVLNHPDSMKFEIFVVDNSREYFDAVFKNSDDKKRIEFVNSDWSSMDKEKKLKEGSFDIIIGDLALGNASQVERTIIAISTLLKAEGFWIGKDIYLFNQTEKEYKYGDLTSILSEHEALDNPKELFSMMLYPVVMFCCNNGPVLSFNTFSTVLNTLKVKKPVLSELVKLFVQFRTLYNNGLSFQVHQIKDIVSHAINNNMFLFETGYGNEFYSNNYPLLVFKKGVVQTLSQLYKSELNDVCQDIKNWFNQKLEYPIHPYLDEWCSKIPSQYYVVRLVRSLGIHNSEGWKKKNSIIVKCVIESINDAGIEVKNDFNCEISGRLKKGAMETEVKHIFRQQVTTTVHNTTKADDDLIFNYQLAVLMYLSAIMQESNNKNDLYEMVSRKLHKRIEHNGSYLWEPSTAPWLTAKICVAAANCSETQSLLFEDDYISATKELVNNFKKLTHRWESEVGSQNDTSALCIEAILLYISKFTDANTIKSAKDVLFNLLKYHVLDANIYETIAVNELGPYSVDMLPKNTTESEEQAQNDIPSEPYQKKLLGRIAFFAALIKIIDHFTKNEGEYLKEYKISVIELQQSREILAYKLFQFWNCFKSNANVNSIIPALNKIDACMVPQILNSLLAISPQ